MRIGFAIVVSLLIGIGSGWAQNAEPERRMSRAERADMQRQIWWSRPRRRDTPLREVNISDREVREIETIMRQRYPGSIVYISGVVSDCPCNDGPKCTDQVWSVATLGDVNNEIALSRIEGAWAVGPLQEWWIIRDRIYELSRKDGEKAREDRQLDYREMRRRIREHEEAFPFCTE